LIDWQQYSLTPTLTVGVKLYYRQSIQFPTQSHVLVQQDILMALALWLPKVKVKQQTSLPSYSAARGLLHGEIKQQETRGDNHRGKKVLQRVE